MGGVKPYANANHACSLPLRLSWGLVTPGQSLFSWQAWQESGGNPPPATSSSVTVTRSDGPLTASWPAVTHATGYHITYSSDGKASWRLAALDHPNASITVSGVGNGKTYVVAVRARNDSGDSGQGRTAVH